MKKVLYLIIVSLLILTFGLTACGGGGGVEGKPQDSGGSEASSGESSAQEAPSGDPVAGKEKFTATCTACHGPEGEGVPGLGKNMTTSEFIAGKTDTELVEFIKVGRDPGDPLNTTGVAMPPKGGNPALTDEDLYDIVAHIRTLQK